VQEGQETVPAHNPNLVDMFRYCLWDSLLPWLEIHACGRVLH
jgi:hypothetical protein